MPPSPLCKCCGDLSCGVNNLPAVTVDTMILAQHEINADTAPGGGPLAQPVFAGGSVTLAQNGGSGLFSSGLIYARSLRRGSIVPFPYQAPGGAPYVPIVGLDFYFDYTGINPLREFSQNRGERYCDLVLNEQFFTPARTFGWRAFETTSTTQWALPGGGTFGSLTQDGIYGVRVRDGRTTLSLNGVTAWEGVEPAGEALADLQLDCASSVRALFSEAASYVFSSPLKEAYSINGYAFDLLYEDEDPAGQIDWTIL